MNTDTTTLVAQASDRSQWNASIAAAADLVIQAIGADVAAGIMPWDVPDFSALHDFVDANEYGLSLLELVGWEFNMADDAQYAWTYAVEGVVAGRLSGYRAARWETDPDGYRAWLHASKVALIGSRAKAFGLTLGQMAQHDGL